MTAPVLEMQTISKAFPGVQALDGASLTVIPGEIHGLVGENGAGKSTLIKVLAGVWSADSGTVRLNGETFPSPSPRSVHEAGVRFIHQELHLVPHFTVAESVFMGQEVSDRLGLVKTATMRARAEAFLEQVLNAGISGRTLVRNLGTAERKLVQIARALIDDAARLVVFDEPTAPLASDEIERLFAAIRRLKQRGIAMIYVSHYLGEITSICDRVTVLRNGQNVQTFDAVSPRITKDMIRAMVGRDIDDMFPDRERQTRDRVLSVEELSGPRFRNISFEVSAGEIFGVAGLIGSGRQELIEALYGLERISGGRMNLEGRTYRPANPASAVRRGAALVPRDRRNDGLVLNLPVMDNLNLASLNEVALLTWERRRAARTRADQYAERIDVRPRDTGMVPRLLSGGNQQKVVLGRWLAKGGRLFMLDEPTAGVDVGAKVEIYNLVERLAAEGSAVIVSSSDPTELIGLCDRVLVMLRGAAVAELPTADLGVDDLVALTTGGVKGSA